MARSKKVNKSPKYVEPVLPYKTKRIEFIDLLQKTRLNQALTVCLVLILLLVSVTMRHSIEKALSHKPIFSRIKYSLFYPKDVSTFDSTNVDRKLIKEIDVILIDDDTPDVYSPVNQKSNIDEENINSNKMGYVDNSHSFTH